jgi:hypothetical protein
MQIHHVRHWADGGRTDRTNLIPLCQHHHQAAHSGRWTVVLERPGVITVRQRHRGEPLYDIQIPPPPPDFGPDLASKLQGTAGYVRGAA